MEDKLLYFRFYIAEKEVQLTVTGRNGAVQEQAVSPLNFEDNLFSALNVLHRLMTAGGRKNEFQPNRAFIRKIGHIQASLLNLVSGSPSAVQKLFEQHWPTLVADPQAGACFTFDFADKAPYTELAELPWEFLSYQNTDLALSENPGCDFIRNLPSIAPPAPPAPVNKGDALNILLLIAEPEAEALRRSDKPLVGYRESYVYRLLRVYENLAAQPDSPVRLRVLYQPRPAEVQQGQLHRRALEFTNFLHKFQKNMVEPDPEPLRSADNQDFRPHIVHFLGHVCTDEREEEMVGCINEENQLVFVPYQAFTACFAGAPPGLFVLQAPEGVQLHRGPFSQNGLLTDLAQKRLPYVLSFQHPLSEQGTLVFMRELYRGLLDAAPVPLAVRASRARLGMGNYADANAFGSPTLYTTLPQAGSLYHALVSAAPAEPSAATGAQAAPETLEQKIGRYMSELRRLIEKADYEAALLKFKEIAEIAVRSPESETPLAERYNDDATSMLGRYNTIETSYKQRKIDENTRNNNRIALGYDLLELVRKFPQVAKKAVETPVANTPRLR